MVKPISHSTTTHNTATQPPAPIKSPSKKTVISTAKQIPTRPATAPPQKTLSARTTKTTAPQQHFNASPTLTKLAVQEIQRRMADLPAKNSFKDQYTQLATLQQGYVDRPLQETEETEQLQLHHSTLSTEELSSLKQTIRKQLRGRLKTLTQERIQTAHSTTSPRQHHEQKKTLQSIKSSLAHAIKTQDTHPLKKNKKQLIKQLSQQVLQWVKTAIPTKDPIQKDASPKPVSHSKSTQPNQP